MMLKDGSEVPVSCAVRPLFEADLIVVVKDEGINAARTTLEAGQHLSEIVCFIELPDTLVDTTLTADVGMLIPGGAGARAGILGRVRPSSRRLNSSKRSEKCR